MKLISYSLWGSKPMFLHGAVVNAKQCREFLPDWKVRIYHNDSIPIELLEILNKLGAETVRVDPKGTYGTFWRFRPLFESDHSHVLVRDVDSRITMRDVRCVNEWLESGKKFLNIRDHPNHYNFPIMAGMFGIRRGALPMSLRPIMEQYALIHEYVADQVFLTRHVWDYMKTDLHDMGIHINQWMADTWNEKNHIGLGFDENEQPREDHGVMGDICI